MTKKSIERLVCVVAGCVLTFLVQNLYCFFAHFNGDWSTVAAIVAAVAAVAGVFVSAITYRNSVSRNRKIETLKEFSSIRERYPNVSPDAPQPVNDATRTEYLKAMERFCTGVNLGLYDIEVVKNISGQMLVTQYENYMGNFVAEKREKSKTIPPEDLYCQYEDVIKKLKEKM